MTLEAAIEAAVEAAVARAIAPLLGVARPLARLSYTIPEAAEVTGAGEYAIREAIKDGRLTGTQAGGKTSAYLIPADALHAWVHGLQQPLPLSRKAR